MPYSLTSHSSHDPAFVFTPTHPHTHTYKKGFPAKLRTAEVSELESDEAEAKREADARRSLINLGVAWSLVLLCCSHHFGHMLHMMGYHQFAHTPFMNLMSNPAVSGALGAFALFGPGRRCVGCSFVGVVLVVCGGWLFAAGKVCTAGGAERVGLQAGRAWMECFSLATNIHNALPPSDASHILLLLLCACPCSFLATCSALLSGAVCWLMVPSP